MAKKTLNFRPDLNLFWPKFGPKKVFLWVLPLPEVKHCYKLSLYAISRETNKPQKKNPFQAQFQPFRPNFGSQNVFSRILPLLDVRPYCKLSLHALSRKTIAPNLRKWQKTQFWAQIQVPIFFRWFYLYQKLDIVASYHCMHFQEKLQNQT